MYGYDDIIVMPGELREFAWSAPMRDLAVKVGLSDVGLKKLLSSRGIPAPPQGYWNKVHAGKAVPSCPRAPARRPGETGRLRVDKRFASILSIANPMPSSGPFASAAVPEDLEALRVQELKAIGRVGVPKALDRMHAGLAQIIKQEERRREKAARDRWAWDLPKFDGPLDKRRLRILSAVFMVLGKRGHWGDAYERDGEIHATAIIGDTRVGIDIGATGPHKTVLQRGRQRASPDLPAKTPLAFWVRPGFDGKVMTTWSDDASGALESKIALITAGLIVAGEERFRASLREAEEFAEQQRSWEEARRLEELSARNRERLQHLHRSGELLRQAEDIRALVARVRQAMLHGAADLDTAAVKAWEDWALAEADKLDPVKSGQFQTHFQVPERGVV